MGQYHIVVNTRKRQYLRADKFEDGLKLMEFGSSGSGTMTGLAILLADSNGRGGGDLHSSHPLIGSWAGDPIVITGDYGDEGKNVPTADIAAYRSSLVGDKNAMQWLQKKGQSIDSVIPNLYSLASQCYEDISDEVIVALCDDPYQRQALIERGVEIAKNWKPPTPKFDPFSLD